MAFLKRYRYTSAILFAVIAVALLFMLAAVTGYRVGPGFKLVKSGTLVLTQLIPGSSFYVDDVYSGLTASEKSISLAPGNHTVIVSAPDMQPWNELVMIGSGAETRVRPIFVAKKVTAHGLEPSEAKAARARLASISLPSKEEPLPMLGGCALVYVEAGRVLAEGTTTPSCAAPSYLCSAGACNPTIIYSSAAGITDTIAFPGRDDALVIAAGTRVFVLELDPRTPEFFAPLARGNAPRVLPMGTSSVEVLEGIYAFEINL